MLSLSKSLKEGEGDGHARACTHTLVYFAYLQCLCWCLRDQGSLLWQKGGETNTQTLQTSALLPNYHVDFANEFFFSLSL